MTNRQVCANWVEGRKGRAGSLSTDGQNLYSYTLRIGRTNSDGCKFVIDYRATGRGFRSMTTSHHVSLAYGMGRAYLTQDALDDEACPIPGHGQTSTLARDNLIRGLSGHAPAAVTGAAFGDRREETRRGIASIL